METINMQAKKERKELPFNTRETITWMNGVEFEEFFKDYDIGGC